LCQNFHQSPRATPVTHATPCARPTNLQVTAASTDFAGPLGTTRSHRLLGTPDVSGGRGSRRAGALLGTAHPGSGFQNSGQGEIVYAVSGCPLPMIQQWIGYAALLNLAYGFQLFLEPYLLNQVAGGALPSEYSPTQLGYWFAFLGGDFPAAAAMSIIIVILTLAIGLIVVFRSGLFITEEN